MDGINTSVSLQDRFTARTKNASTVIFLVTFSLHRWSILGQSKLSVLVSAMADNELTPEGDRESKLYIASNNRPRLGSDSSYVTLRETAKIKQGIRKKNERQTPAKGKEKRREDGNRSVKGNPSHFPNTQCCSGLCIHRLLQFLVLFLSVCSLTIIILMILGILGPDHCPCKNTGEVHVAWCWFISRSLGRQFFMLRDVRLFLVCWS